MPSPGSLPVYIASLRRLVEPDRPPRTPPERLLTRAPGYLLQVAPGELDAADFEALAAEGNRHLAEGRPQAARRLLGEALSLWRGRALEEFGFAELEAERLESLRVAATEDRVEADLRLGAHTAVVGELEQLVHDHGLRERLVGLLMLALYRSGRQGEALRAYTSAREDLGQELGIDPGPDLRRLEADILAQSPSLDWAPPPPEGVVAPVHADPRAQAVEVVDPFVGRAAELAAMDSALAGAGGVVLVSGEPGIGKTRLVREAVAGAEARGSLVAWGRGEEGDGAPPFWPWTQVIRALLVTPDTGAVRAALGRDAAVLAQVVPEVAEVTGVVEPPPPLDPAAARHRFLEAVGGFLERLSTDRPVAIVLDDLHWADPPSLELAAHLARRMPALRAVLVATYRDVDPAPNERLADTLAVLARLPGRVDLPLQGLTEQEVAEYIGHEAGGVAPAEVVAAVWARAAGNPFFVGELTRLLVAEKGLGKESTSAAAVPWAVRQVVERRLARLPGGTRELLTVAAVAGTEFDIRVVAGAAGVDQGRALDLVDVAVAAGVVKEQQHAAVERFEFTHGLVQETVYQEATRLRRAHLHAQVADALELVAGDQAPAAEIARHLYEAVPATGPVRAAVAGIRASTSAQAALAHDVAEAHLRRALDLVATMSPGRQRDELELDVQDHLAALLTLVKGVAVPETAATWARATELCREIDDRRRLLPSLWGLLSYAWANGDLEGARTLGEHILRLGQAASEPVVTAAAHLGLGSVALCAGDLGSATTRLVAGKRLADGVPDRSLADVTYADLRVQVDSWLAMARHLEGRHVEGRRLADGALARARGIGGPFTMAIGLAFAAFARVLSGAADEAEDLAQELLLQSGTHQLADFAFHANVVHAWTLSQRAVAGEDLAALVDGLPPAGAAGIRPWRPFWLSLIAEVWQGLGRWDRAGQAVDEALAEVEGMGASFCGAELLRQRAEIVAESEGGRQGDALADLGEAVRLATAQGATLYLGRAEAALVRLGGTRPEDATAVGS